MKQVKQDIKHGSHIGQVGVKISLNPMMQFLGFADHCQHGKDRFNDKNSKEKTPDKYNRSVIRK